MALSQLQLIALLAVGAASAGVPIMGTKDAGAAPALVSLSLRGCRLVPQGAVDALRTARPQLETHGRFQPLAVDRGPDSTQTRIST